MKKSCSYCGRVHPRGYICPYKPKPPKRYYKQYHKQNYIKTDNEKFRSSIKWQKKRAIIAQRDLFLCRVCLENGEYTQDIQVHHITPLKTDFSKRLDDDNLISLCPHHHELAERGAIPAEHLRELAASPPCSDGRASFS